jgi:hypothetical protein
LGLEISVVNGMRRITGTDKYLLSLSEISRDNTQGVKEERNTEKRGHFV